MKITKLKLNNFSSYEGTNIFDFATSKNKTIVLIGGQNGAGKTSIFDAIKIALYGPLAFGYTGANSFYSKKIKSYINSKTYSKSECCSGVEIHFAIKQDRDIKKYILSREWTIDDKKLTENYRVVCNGEEYDESEKVYFDRYLQSVIPPNLFDFFLFDGEEVGNIFSDESYNKYIKDAILTMCGIDTYAIIQKFCSSFVSKSDDDGEQQLNNEYAEVVKSISDLQETILTIETRKEEISKEVEELTVLNEQIEEIFKKSGGISEAKKAQMQKECNELDKKRSEISVELKSFVENDMPFYLVRGFIRDIEKQINYEEKESISEYVGNMISPDFIKKVIEEKTGDADALSEEVYNAIMNKLKPISSEGKKRIFDMSRDEIGKVESVIDTVESIDTKKLAERIKRRDKYTKQIITYNQELRESLSAEDSEKFLKEMKDNESKIISIQSESDNLDQICEANRLLLIELTSKKDSLYSKILETASNNHAYALSSEIAQIMDELINSKTESIRKKLADYTIANLREMYRKDNLISSMEVTNDFKFILYQQSEYTIDDMKSIIANMGFKEFISQIGSAGVDKLYNLFSVTSEDELKNALLVSSECHSILLNRKIELTRLSKGERQIFVLALYQAIIQVSNKDIPFIIDTPYARIDTQHREEISRKFFPNISKQVIILSTDEEITKDYYPIIKPYIAKEYLLSNNQSENRTTVSKGYFFEV